VSKSEKIAALETLLARVRSRAGEPREARQSLAAVSPVVPAPPSEPPPSDEIDAVTIPPPPALLRQLAPPPMRAALPTEADVVVDVNVLQDAVGDTVIGVAAEEEAGTGESPGSREQLVAAGPAMGLVVPMPAPESLPEEPSDLLASVERVEETPVSSRRPVATEPEQRLSDMTYGTDEEESLPRHTPPPESGRLPAGPSTGDPDADVTGVRESPVMPPRGHVPVPEAIRADLSPHDAVADIVGEAQPFAPSTFAALLDAGLAL
jgi:hypothetical protein